MSSGTKVTLFKGWAEEKTLPIKDVVIPDVWHIAQAISQHGKVDHGPACADAILNCWHIAGALKNHIMQQQGG